MEPLPVWMPLAARATFTTTESSTAPSTQALTTKSVRVPSATLRPGVLKAMTPLASATPSTGAARPPPLSCRRTLARLLALALLTLSRTWLMVVAWPSLLPASGCWSALLSKSVTLNAKTATASAALLAVLGSCPTPLVGAVKVSEVLVSPLLAAGFTTTVVSMLVLSAPPAPWVPPLPSLKVVLRVTSIGSYKSPV